MSIYWKDRAPRRVYDFEMPSGVLATLRHVSHMPCAIAYWSAMGDDGLKYGLTYIAKYRAWVLANQLPPRGRAAIAPSIRAAVRLRDGNKCLRCGSTKDIQLDHIIPWCRGGEDTVANLQCLCGVCNRQKWHEDKAAS